MAVGVVPVLRGWPVLAVRGDETLLAGRPLFRGSTDALLDGLHRMVTSGGRHLVMTPNVDQVLSLRSDPATRDAMSSASMLLADGAPLIGLARLLGDRGIRRHTGADLIGAAVGRAAVHGWTVAIAGGDSAVAADAAARLAAEHPGAVVESVPFPHITGPTDPAGAEVVDRLTALRPQLVFVCLGSPKQEAWFLHWRERLPAAVYVGAGAAVEFAAGTRSRAPRAVQAVGAEWLWRLAQEPRRLARRYLLKGPGFIGVVGASLVGARR